MSTQYLIFWSFLMLIVIALGYSIYLRHKWVGIMQMSAGAASLIVHVLWLFGIARP